MPVIQRAGGSAVPVEGAAAGAKAPRQQKAGGCGNQQKGPRLKHRGREAGVGDEGKEAGMGEAGS